MPDGYYTEEGRRDLKGYVVDMVKDWESHSEKLAAAKAAARRGREPLSFMVWCLHDLHRISPQEGTICGLITHCQVLACI